VKKPFLRGIFSTQFKQQQPQPPQQQEDVFSTPEIKFGG